MWIVIVVLSLIVLFFLYFNMSQYFRRKHTKDILYEFCNTKKYLEELEDQIEKYGKGGKNRYVDILNMDKAIGLNYAGRFKQAYNLLNTITPEKLPKRLKIFYYTHRVGVLLNIDRVKEAGNILKQQKKYFQYMEYDKQTRLVVKFRVAEYEYYKGKYDDSKEKLEDVTDQKMLPVFQCEAYYYLALVYKKLKNNKKSKEYLKEANRIAGQTYIRQVTERLLTEAENEKS